MTSESLPAPGQTSVRTARVAASPQTETPSADALQRLPDTVRIVPVQIGQYWVRAGQFTQSRYAEALKNRISGVPVRVQRENSRRQPGYLVMAGPFASIADADAGLDQVRRSGVTDASIVVE